MCVGEREGEGGREREGERGRQGEGGGTEREREVTIIQDVSRLLTFQIPLYPI